MLRAISLWQPWATLMAGRLKLNETRSWPTGHRGELAICASKRRPTVRDTGLDPGQHQRMLATVPFGACVCIVHVTDCVRVTAAYREHLSEQERQFGNYDIEHEVRYAWVTDLDKLQVLHNPVPITGRQGLWTLDPDQEASVRQQVMLQTAAVATRSAMQKYYGPKG